MWLSDLQEHDYKVLEEYWFRFQKLSAMKVVDPIKKRNIHDITSAVATLYNESDGIMREIIEDGYFDSPTGTMDSKHIAEQLGISVNRLSIMRKGLMKETAELISYI